MKILFTVFTIVFLFSSVSFGGGMEKQEVENVGVVDSIIFEFKTITEGKLRIPFLLPDVVLYSNGDYILTKDKNGNLITKIPYLKNNIEIGRLSKEQFCKVLTLNKGNKFNKTLNSIDFDQNTKLTFVTGIDNNSTLSKVNKRSIIKTYEILRDSKSKMTSYKPEEVLTVFTQISKDDLSINSFPVKKWIFGNLDFSNTYKHKIKLMKGEDASKVYEYFGKNRFVIVSHKNKTYKVHVRPLLPFEVFDLEDKKIEYFFSNKKRDNIQQCE